MTLVNRKQISLYDEAKAGLNSLVKQTAQVGVGLLGMLLLTGGNPPALTVGLSVVGGIAFVAWSEEKRLTKFYARQTQLIHNSVIVSETLAERSEGKQSQIPDTSESEPTKFGGRQSQLKHNPVIASKIILALVASATMLFALLAYDHNTNLRTYTTQTGPACYGATCTGRDPKEAGCDKGADTITSTVGSFPELRKDLKNFKVEMRYSARCKSSWIKAPQVIGATIYFEDKAGKRYVPLEILNDGINEAHFTDMFFRDIESRGCIEYPGKKAQCTGFVKGQS
jgi:hypothetical protein